VQIPAKRPKRSLAHKPSSRQLLDLNGGLLCTALGQSPLPLGWQTLEGIALLSVDDAGANLAQWHPPLIFAGWLTWV
jgi:hypothetical protein